MKRRLAAGIIAVLLLILSLPTSVEASAVSIVESGARKA